MPLANADSFRIPLADKSVHCIVTSTPYFGLRKYSGVKPTVFGGRADCEHDWATSEFARNNDQTAGEKQNSNKGSVGRDTPIQVSECSKCGAWRGFFGEEKLHDCNAWAKSEEPCGKCFACHFRELAREMWRVLRDDGTAWIVIADSYATTSGGGQQVSQTNTGAGLAMDRVGAGKIPGLKPKDKMLVPERVRLALQAEGWYVRSVAPWIKRSAMPESCEDRPGTATEDIILLAKSQRYYYDHIAVRKDKAAASLARQTRGVSDHHKNIDGAPGQPPHSMNQPRPNRNLAYTFARPDGKNTTLEIPGQAAPSHRADRDDECAPGRNRRTTDWWFESLDGLIEDAQDDLDYMKRIRDKGGMMVDGDGNPLAFLVNPRGYHGAHYATFALDLVIPMIQASTSAAGVCPKCGAQLERVIEKPDMSQRPTRASGSKMNTDAVHISNNWQGVPKSAGQAYQEWRNANPDTTTGWRPTCDCSAGDPVPAKVLDPFVGSGTTVEAARQLGRTGIGLDISMTYLSNNALPRAEKKSTRESIEALPLFALDSTPAPDRVPVLELV